MNRKQLISNITAVLKDSNKRKEVSSPKHTFHISDDHGNSKDFVVKATEKTVMYTTKDVEAIIDACIKVVEDSIKRGEAVTIQGFGSLHVHHRKGRKTKSPGTDEWVDVPERYIPKFDFGNRLRLAARVYGWSLKDTPFTMPPPVNDDVYEEDDE